MKTISHPPVPELLNRLLFAFFCATAFWFATSSLTSCEETLYELPNSIPEIQDYHEASPDTGIYNGFNEEEGITQDTAVSDGDEPHSFPGEEQGISIDGYEAGKADAPFGFTIEMAPCSRNGLSLKVKMETFRGFIFNWEIDGHLVSEKPAISCVDGKEATITVIRESDQLTVIKKLPISKKSNPKYPFNFAVVKTNCATGSASVQVSIEHPQNYTYSWTVDGKAAGTSSVLPCTCGLAAEVTVKRKSDGRKVRRLISLPACTNNPCGFVDESKKSGIEPAFVVNGKVVYCFAGGTSISVIVDDSASYAYLWEVNGKVAGNASNVTCICGNYAKVRVTRKCDGSTVFKSFNLPECIDK